MSQMRQDCCGNQFATASADAARIPAVTTTYTACSQRKI
jgi:hypothetical protein